MLKVAFPVAIKLHTPTYGDPIRPTLSATPIYNTSWDMARF